MRAIKSLIISIALTLTLITGASAEFFSDIIVTSPDGIWTDSRAYNSLTDAVNAVGSTKQRTIVISSQLSVGNITIPSNITLKFERDGAIINSGQLTLNTRNIIAENRQIFAGAGDIDFTSGTVLKSGWFSTFERAATLTSDDSVTLIITKPQTLTTSVALGNNVVLKWDGSGNILTANTGVDIQNICNIEAGDFQLFAGAGDFDFRDGTSLNLRWFARLRSLLAWVESENVTIVVPGENTVDYSETATSNELFDFKSRQGSFSINGAVTLTLNSPSNVIASPNQQIFSGAGTVSFSTGGIAYANWGGGTLAGFNMMATAVANNSKLIVSPGSYSFAGTWAFSSKSDIEVEGYGATITETTNVTKLMTFTTCNRVKVKGFRLVGVGTDFDNSAHTNAKMIYLEGCDDVVISENVIYNFGNTGVWIYQTSNVKVINNTIEGPGVAEISSGDNYCQGICAYGDGDSYGTLLIEGNEISETCHGILSSEGWHHLKISNNQIKDVRGQHGIYVGPADNISITGNIVENPEYIGIKVQLTSTASRNYEGMNISGNTVRDSGQVAIIVVNLAAAPFTQRGVTVSNNTLVDCSEGIHVRGISGKEITGVNVSSNNISGTTDAYGIFVTYSDGVIQNNLVDSTAQTGIYCIIETGHEVDIIGNVVTNAVQDAAASGDDASGIYLAGTGTYTVKDNIVKTGTGSPDYSFYTSTDPTYDLINNYLEGTLTVPLRGTYRVVRGNYGNTAYQAWSEGIVFGAVGAGCTSGTTPGYAGFLNTIRFSVYGYVKAKSGVTDYWDLTGVSTGATEYKKVLLCMDFDNYDTNGLIVEGTVADTQGSAKLPDAIPYNYAVLGVVEIPNSYSGGDLAGCVFYDYVGAWPR